VKNTSEYNMNSNQSVCYMKNLFMHHSLYHSPTVLSAYLISTHC